MISRHWCGIAQPAHADRYVEHLSTETFPALKAMPGFVDSAILRRNVARGVEFLIVTRWASLRAIEQFAGADSEVAVVPAHRVSDGSAGRLDPAGFRRYTA